MVFIREVYVSKVALRMRLGGGSHLKILIRHHCGVSIVLRKWGYFLEIRVYFHFLDCSGSL